MTVPIMILIGYADDWTPAESCRTMVAQPRGEGACSELVVYPGACHGFTFLGCNPASVFLGHWLEYDKNAAADAWEKVSTFLATNLANRP